MFGSSKIRNLEDQLSNLNEKLQQTVQERDSLRQQLEAARQRIGEMENQLRDTDLEQLKDQEKATIAEYEGLKDLYARKIQAFDASKEEQEQAFAREAALQRHNLENEIRDNRQASQDYVSSTVKTFSESYNYYLNQIKLLMDALGDVAARTGEALFSESNDDLKAKIGQQMADKLKAETDPLRSDNGDLILIGTVEEPEEPEEVEEPEEPEEPEESEEPEEPEESEEPEEAEEPEESEEPEEAEEEEEKTE